MSLYNAKCRAIRQIFIHNEENFNKLTKYLQEQGIENMPYSQLAEHFITNGDCGLDVDLEMPLREAFVDYVDKHTTAPLYEIWNIVNEWCGEDFLMDPWEFIYDEHFKAWDIYDEVVYIVQAQWEGRKWENTTTFEIFSTYEKAKQSFDDSKVNAELDMDRISDEWVTEVDNEDRWLGQDNEFESWIELNLYKKGVL